MKTSLQSTVILSSIALLFITGCNKNSTVWDDSNTMGSYKRAHEKVLWGSSDQENPLALSETEELMELEAEFIALEDEDLQEEFTEVVFAQSSESPGDSSSPLPGIDGFSLPSGALAEVFKNVYFNTDEYVFKKQEYHDILARTAVHLVKNPDLYVFVSGNCDERGSEAYNLALGTRRANYVRNQLIEKGVSPEKIFTISYGKEKLTDFSNTPSGWALNRRAEFKLYEKRRGS